MYPLNRLKKRQVDTQAGYAAAHSNSYKECNFEKSTELIESCLKRVTFPLSLSITTYRVCQRKV